MAPDMEGYVGLFMSALLAATVLPFSSEAVLVGLAAIERYDPWLMWLAASVGNTAGAWINWLLGRFIERFKERRWFPFNATTIERAGDWFRRFGVWSLLLAWLPVIGDPLTLVAGVFRVNVWFFLALVFAGKAARYAIVLLSARELLNL